MTGCGSAADRFQVVVHIDQAILAEQQAQAEAGKPLASNPRIAKIAFTGETTTGRLIMQYASQNIIPVTLELGGKSPNIFFSDVAAENDAFYDKALEGFTLFAFNQGEVCTAGSRLLVERSIKDTFLPLVIEALKGWKPGNPLDPATNVGALVDTQQMNTVLSYIEAGQKEGAELKMGGKAARAETGTAPGSRGRPERPRPSHRRGGGPVAPRRGHAVFPRLDGLLARAGLPGGRAGV